MADWDMQTFRRAAQDAGITGEDRRGNRAIDEFARYYEENYDSGTRKNHGYWDIREIAQKWWGENRRDYFGQSFGDDEDRYT